ncbi:MAG TPA: fluoride efflux transporter CrcB [Nitrosomonas halophila]|nr:fluoride efflux transporter CrcB [Nitrosomonas halophila]
MKIALSVALGAGVGGVFRVAVTNGVQQWYGPDFPLGVLLVNIIGSFLIGFLATITAPEGRFYLSPALRQFAMAGFCGGFTTFSFFSLQTLQLIESGQAGLAALYSVLTLILSMIAVWSGHGLGMRLSRG